MSSVISKQLGEFLQEQQEPFILEVYLLERGCSTRRFSTESVSGFGYSSSNAGKFMRRSVSSGFKGNRTFIPNCSRFVRALFSKLLTVADDKKINKFSGTRDKRFCVSSETDSSSKETSEDDKYSSASSSTFFHSCSESDGEDVYFSLRREVILATADYYQPSKDEHFLREKKVRADQSCGWRNNEDCRQLSPVSVLEDNNKVDDDASPFHKKNDDARRRQIQFSIALCAYKSGKPLRKSDASSQYSRNKKAVQQSKELLFDCVREVVERIKKDPSDDDQQSPRILGPEKLWELICQDISLWSKEPINETNTNRLVGCAIFASAQEWSKFQQTKEEIGIQITNAILEDIKDEIIIDMIDLHQSL